MRSSCHAVFALALGLFTSAAPAQNPAPDPQFYGLLQLVRYDLPRGRSDGFAPTRQLAVRRDGEDAVDWPALTLNGQPIFREKAEERVAMTLRKGAEAQPLFQMPGDDVISPGNHWLRAIEWRNGRRHLYTADKTARCANAGEAMTGRHELWTFPVKISGQGGPHVRNVVLRAGSAVIYKKDGPWRSLTLLLPANEPGVPYEISVDGRPPVKFQAGLMPVKLGTPREQLFAFDTTLTGDGPKLRVRTLTRPDEFPNPKEWAADVVALAQGLPAASAFERPAGMARHLGVEVPRSPLTLYAAALPHGMSGGFPKQPPAQGVKPFPGNAEAYAEYLAELGLDAVFDPVNALPAPNDVDSFEARAAALARRGIALGLQYDNNWSRPSLQHPNLAFFAHTLPEWHAPLYRSLSLAAQRFARLPNFLGICIGADNAGYAPYWSWAPPIPDRPWGEAMIEFAGTAQPIVPRAPALGARERGYEKPVQTMEEFIKFVGRYDATFQQYGYFAEAVRDVDRRLVFTTGSFGSSPGNGARGGWPWASVPGRVMSEGLSVQQAYDWNEKRAAKPLHNVALTDRIRSYSPKKKTWALLDNFGLLYGREAFQRACALALTRGVQGIGTNFLPNPSGDTARPDVVAFQKEVNEWMRRFGGVYARTEPQATIGIFFGHHQAVQRRVVEGLEPAEEALHGGSHEGKVTEALFFCHAAGWPARVITFQELTREPLPTEMRAILLVGLDKTDESWHWAPGLEKPLQQFLDRGGRILADRESFCPVPCTRTELRVAAGQPQGNVDPTPLLFARNAENIATLRAALGGFPAPIAVSESPMLWAIPTVCGDTQYVTAINQAFAEGDEAREMLRPADPRATKPEEWKTKGNASLWVKPQIGALKWNTQRPIYDVRLGRKLGAEEAANVDLTKDAFRWYALPPREVTAPEVAMPKAARGFFEATAVVGGEQPMSGVPVKFTVTRGGETAEVFSTSGVSTRLPVRETDGSAAYTVTATELLSGLASASPVTWEMRGANAEAPGAIAGVLPLPPAAKTFAARKHVALTIALTPEQERDGAIAVQVKALEDFYRGQGRIVSRGKVAPGGVVESLQPLRSPHRFPQWKTIAADLVLFGTPANNVLLLDQARGQLFPRDFALPKSGEVRVLYTRSPFVGEYDAVNIIAADASGIANAVRALTAPAKVTAR